MSFVPTGTVYGTLLNFRGELEAPGEVACYALMNDLSVPHASFFRPPAFESGI